MPIKSLIVLHSYHHKNTEAIAKVLAQVLNSEIVAPREVNTAELAGYDLVGFGAGIDSGKHYRPILDLADMLLPLEAKNAFIFSTCGAPAFIVSEKFIRSNHAALREKLRIKGYSIIDEFGCPGFNTNVFLKYFGGLDKNRPNARDFERAEAFALSLMQKMS